MPAIYSASADVETSKAGGRAVLYHRQTGAATILNPTGSILWGLLDRPRTADELADALCAQFPQIDPSIAIRDTEAFLSQLLQSKLLKAEPDATGHA